MSMPSLPHQPFNPFFDTIRQNVELSHGITERIPLKLTARAKQRIADLPFAWLRTIALRTTSHLETDVEESMESLAMQFYRIELAEQRRLMGVMEHHSRESLVQNYSERKGVPVKPFPFSITAGVEKGAKNRYDFLSSSYYIVPIGGVIDIVISGPLNTLEYDCIPINQYLPLLRWIPQSLPTSRPN